MQLKTELKMQKKVGERSQASIHVISEPQEKSALGYILLL